MRKTILAIAIVLIILFLLWWFFCQPEPEVETEYGWTVMCTSPSGTIKLHEDEVGVKSTYCDIESEECCEGDVYVEFEYEWEFYDEAWAPPSGDCAVPVRWMLYDSEGFEVFTDSDDSPMSTFGDPVKIEDGIWDCYLPWTVSVVNGCLCPINYDWELTFYCYEVIS